VRTLSAQFAAYIKLADLTAEGSINLPIETAPSIAGRTIRCLLFDVGETLWTRPSKETMHNLEHVSEQRAIAILYRHIPTSAYRPSNTIHLGKQLRHAVDQHAYRATKQKPGYEPDFALAAQQALHELGFADVDKTLGAEIFEALRVRITVSRLVFEDVFPTMAELRKRGFQLGIVTNRQYGGQPFEEDLRELGFLDYFAPRSIAVSADLGIRKPTPEIFLHALNGLGVPPEEAAMVGDSLRADVAGARRLGISAIWKPKLRLRAAAEADLLSHYAMQPSPQEAISSTAESASAPIPKITDDYLLKYVREHDKHNDRHWDHALTPITEPDLIIEHTKDLLKIFLKAGKQ
jgi:HAD superfamily hydrolase (TIGR01549 family)